MTYTNQYKEHVNTIGKQILNGFQRWQYNNTSASIEFYKHDGKLIGRLEVWELIDLVIANCRDKNGA